MSYQPTQPNGSTTGPRSNENPGFISPGKVRYTRKNGVPWLVGCGLLLAGFVIGLVALIILALFYFGSPASDVPLPTRPPVQGAADLTATLSESYLNSEIMREVKSKPLSIAGVVDLKEITLQIQPDGKIQVAARLGNFLVDIDVSVVDSISIQNGQVVVHAEGEPKIGKGSLPVNVNTAVQLINSSLVEPQINNAIINIKVNGRSLKLIDLQTSDRNITVKFQAL